MPTAASFAHAAKSLDPAARPYMPDQQHRPHRRAGRRRRMRMLAFRLPRPAGRGRRLASRTV
jgi:hypothetical protein